MQWKKTPPELAAKFDKASLNDPTVVRKPMFGYPALFLNGNMFAGTFQDKIVVRLDEGARLRALQSGAAQFAPMPGRPMKEYVVVPLTDASKPAALATWIGQARAYAATLPEKTKAGTKRTTAKKTAKTTTAKRG